MQLHQLQGRKPTDKKTRVGRGGKRGTYSGRGVKGQRSRAGARIRPEIRDFIKKLPKMRGYAFPGTQPGTGIVSVALLEKHFETGQNVSVEKLRKKGLVDRRTTTVKILADGELTKALKITGLGVSTSAAEKIKKAGGTIHE